MRKFYVVVGFVLIFFTSLKSWGQVSLIGGGTYTQNFDVLGTSAIGTYINNTTLTGWYITTTPGLPINTGSTGTNSCYNFGNTGTNPNTDRALGAISTSIVHRIGLRVLNNGSAPIGSFDISFTGEQWRSFNAGNLVFEYQTGTTVTSITAGTWTAFSALDFASLQTSTGAALDGNSAANRTLKTSTLTVPVAQNTEIFFRWTRAGTSSPGLAIDDLSVTANAAGNSITTSAISGSPFCVTSSTGSLVSVPFTSTGTYTSNTYTAQLSNASGSFASPTSIGTLVSDGNSGTIAATIPAGTTGGTGYRIRVISSSPVATGTDNGTNLTVNVQPAIGTQPVNKTVTSPTGTTFSVSATGGTGVFQWQYYNSGTSTWTDITNTAPYSGVTTSTLTISTTTVALDQTDYRCIAKAGSPCTDVISSVATLYVNPGPCITDASGYSGWTLSGATSAPNQACSGNGILFTASGQYVITPVVTNPQKLNFNKKRSNTATAWELDVQISNSTSGPWTNVSIENVISNICTANNEIDLSSYVGNFYIRFLDNRVSGAEQRGIDDITITCGTACTPGHTITSFTPNSGPAGTLVTIIGTGFTSISGSNAVKFGSVNATSYNVVNTTTIIAEVPINAPTDKITITNSSCPLKTAGNFTLTQTSGTCGSGGSFSSDVFISEIYDHPNGSLTYVEIFNGTTSTIDLSTYSIRIQTNTSDNSYPLSGTIASSTTKILKIGEYNTFTCSGLTANWDYPAAPGINGNDRIYLYKDNGVTWVDYAPNPNYDGADSDNGPTLVGFTQKRNASAVAPSITYIATDWTVVNTQSCSHLGIGPYTVSAPSLTVNTSPSDVGCTQTITLSVSATATSPATINSSGGYLWKFNDPVAMSGWDNVSEMAGSPYNLPLTITGVGTNSITIIGSTAILQNFQFYVEVSTAGSPSCMKASNAAQYAYDTRKYYRTSTATGNWSDKDKWEMSSDNATWVAACNYPTSVNCDEITIRAAHTITLDIDNAVDKLTIDNLGNLISSANSQLTLLNGQTGANFIINGTFEDGANSANSLSFGTNATWQIGAAASLIKTNNSSATIYRDNYETGIANITAAANWIYRYSGSALSFASSTTITGMHYPNLTLENIVNGNTYSSAPNATDINLSNFTLTGANNPVIIKGNFNVGGSGPGNINFVNANTNGLVQVWKDLTIRAGSKLTNNAVPNITIKGAGLDVRGNLTVDGTLENNGGAATGLLKFSANASDQTISGVASGIINLQDVTNANTGGSRVNVDKSMNIHGVLTLSDGTNFNLLSGYVNLRSTATATARLASVNTGVLNYNGTGRFVVERYFGTHRAWRLMTAPVSTGAAATDNSFFNSYQGGGVEGLINNATYISGALANPSTNGFDVTPLNNSSLKKYNSATNLFEPIPNTRNEKISGNTFSTTGVPDNFGFFMFVRGDRTKLTTNSNWVTPGATVTETTLRDTGKLQVQSYTFPAYNAVNGYTLIGNPYASPVDFTKVLANISTSGIANRFWSWDPNLNAVGAYVYFDGAASYAAVKVPVSASGTIGQTTIIQSKQAVFVQSTSASSPQVVFREADKDATNNQAAYRPMNNLPIAPMLAANIYYADKDGNKVLLDGNMVQAAKEFSNEVNYLEDAIKFTNINENFAIKNKTGVLILDKRKPFTETDTINYTISRTSKRTYQLQFMADQIEANNLTAYLEDNFQKTSTPVNMDGDTWFDFEVNGNAASAAPDRFRMVFKKAVHHTNIKAALINSDIAVEWSLINETDISNHEVERSADGIHFIKVGAVNSQGNGAASSIYNWLDVQPASGIYYYRIKSIGLYGAVAYSETVKVKMVNSAPGMYVFPNPVTDSKINLQLNKFVPGIYRVRVLNATGQELMKQNLSHLGGNATHTVSPNQRLISGAYELEVMAPDKKKTVLKILVQ